MSKHRLVTLKSGTNRLPGAGDRGSSQGSMPPDWMLLHTAYPDIDLRSWTWFLGQCLPLISKGKGKTRSGAAFDLTEPPRRSASWPDRAHTGADQSEADRATPGRLRHERISG